MKTECALSLEILELLKAGCPNLQEIDFEPASTITVEGLAQFAKSCCYLTKIILRDKKSTRYDEIAKSENERKSFFSQWNESGWAGELEFRQNEE